MCASVHNLVYCGWTPWKNWASRWLLRPRNECAVLWWVCMFVCHISKTTLPNFTNFCICLNRTQNGGLGEKRSMGLILLLQPQKGTYLRRNDVLCVQIGAAVLSVGEMKTPPQKKIARATLGQMGRKVTHAQKRKSIIRPGWNFVRW